MLRIWLLMNKSTNKVKSNFFGFHGVRPCLPRWVLWHAEQAIHVHVRDLSLCLDGWFNLCAWLPNPPQVCSLSQPQSLIGLARARWGCSSQPSTTHTPQWLTPPTRCPHPCVVLCQKFHLIPVLRCVGPATLRARSSSTALRVRPSNPLCVRGRNYPNIQCCASYLVNSNLNILSFTHDFIIYYYSLFKKRLIITI